MTTAHSSTTFADMTTIGVGGPIRTFLTPHTRDEVIATVREADDAGVPLSVIGGGSNLLVSDDPFDGVVVRDARQEIRFGDVQADGTVSVSADAGCNWDDFVAVTVSHGLEGVEGLSGIPGTVGASVVQNIGAYGQEVASSVTQVDAWDRQHTRIVTLDAEHLDFGYRTSALKTSMYDAPARPSSRFFPTPRFVVLSVTFRLRNSDEGTVGYGQLAKALGVEVGDRMAVTAIRDAVLTVRAAKGMLEDAHRYRIPAMAGAKRDDTIAAALHAQREATGTDSPDFNRHSCGSFFTNPILNAAQAAALPDDAPRFPATLPSGEPGTKTSAAWLIDHAGFHKGYAIADNAPASLSTLHTLALTNRGSARAEDIAVLARTVRDGVEHAYGIRLIPEPVIVGLEL